MTQTSSATEPVAADMRGVIPYIAYAGRANEAADFYAKAFEATDLGRLPNPENPAQLMHAQLRINGGSLMMTDHGCDQSPDTGPLNRAHLQLIVADGRLWWDRAIAAGCSVVMPYERQFWGDDWGLLADPFGIHWAILQPGPGRGEVATQ